MSTLHKSSATKVGSGDLEDNEYSVTIVQVKFGQEIKEKVSSYTV